MQSEIVKKIVINCAPVNPKGSQLSPYLPVTNSRGRQINRCIHTRTRCWVFKWQLLFVFFFTADSRFLPLRNMTWLSFSCLLSQFTTLLLLFLPAQHLNWYFHMSRAAALPLTSYYILSFYGFAVVVVLLLLHFTVTTANKCELMCFWACVCVTPVSSESAWYSRRVAACTCAYFTSFLWHYDI